nr:SIMPL domain-containing protein [Enterovirga sp. DB1703]
MRRLAFSTLCLAGWASAALAQPAPGPEPGRISVIGQATIETPPDFAAVQIGVTSKAATAAAALADNSAAVARTIALAKTMGVEPRDVATSAVSLHQAFRSVRTPSGVEQQPDGYQAQNVVTVRLADMGRLGQFMQQAVEGGANRIDSVSFGLREPGKAEREAAVAATRDALARARAVAEAAGVTLGPVERITTPPRAERPGHPPYPVMRMATAESQAKAVPLEAGTLAVSAEVEVVWALRQ